MNPNWPRWIFASICKHAEDNRQSVKLFIEGGKRVTDDSEDRFELRTNGPIFSEISQGVYRVEITVNLLISCKINQQDYYNLQRKEGIALGIITPIGLYKYGTETGIDTGELFACMNLWQGPVITHYGQLKPSIEVLQTTVEGRYKVLLED